MNGNIERLALVLTEEKTKQRYYNDENADKWCQVECRSRKHDG